MRLEIELTDAEAIEVAAHVLRAPSVVGRRLFMAIAQALPGSPAAPVSAKGPGVATPALKAAAPKVARSRGPSRRAVEREVSREPSPLTRGWLSGVDDLRVPPTVDGWEAVNPGVAVLWTKCPEIDDRWRGLDDAGNLCQLEVIS